ncbi:uncharacterized protein LOC115448096 isoform X2 [Manduca sexta]|nr:uncharacterized protein LOC115448096 isoform X2 [Manduca sexta]
MSLLEGPHPLYPCSEEDMQEIRAELGLKESTLQEDIDAILDWFQKQPHLVEAGIEREMVERMLVISKGSMEKTKRRIDNYYKYRGLTPEVIQNRDKVLSGSNDLWTSYMQMSIPKLYKGKRLTLVKFFDNELNNFSAEVIFRNTFMLADIRLKYDYFLSDIWIVDMKNTGFSHLLRLNPIVMQKTAQMFQEGLGVRVHAIHIINAIPALSHVVSFLKQFFSPKIMDRLIIHDSLEDLYQHIPKKYLPEDYGGLEPSTSVFKDKYEKELRNTKTKQYLIEASKMVSNENLRPGSNINEEYLAGSFRKLDFD